MNYRGVKKKLWAPSFSHYYIKGLSCHLYKNGRRQTQTILYFQTFQRSNETYRRITWILLLKPSFPLHGQPAEQHLLEAAAVLSCGEAMCDLSDWPEREMSQQSRNMAVLRLDSGV